MRTADNSRLEIRATCLVALSAIMYGFLGILGTELLKQHFSIWSMLFWRFFIATLWIFVWLSINKKPTRSPVTSRFELYKAFILGAICYASSSLFYFLASQQIGTGLAMVLFFTYPIFVVALTWIFDKNATGKYTVAALIAIILGIFLIKGNHIRHLTLSGIIFIAMASLSYGFYLYASKKIIKNFSTHLFTLLVCLSCTLVFFIASVYEHNFSYPASLETWFYVITLGVIATALPIQLLLMGLKHIHPNKVSILSVLEPLVTLLIGVILLHETTTVIQTIGAAVILFSAICIQFEN